MSLKDLNKTQLAAVEACDGPVLIFAGAGRKNINPKIFYLSLLPIRQQKR